MYSENENLAQGWHEMLEDKIHKYRRERYLEERRQGSVKEGQD